MSFWELDGHKSRKQGQLKRQLEQWTLPGTEPTVITSSDDGMSFFSRTIMTLRFRARSLHATLSRKKGGVKPRQLLQRSRAATYLFRSARTWSTEP